MNTGEGGSWNLEGVKFFRAGVIKSWAMVSFVSKDVALRPGPGGLQEFTMRLIETLNNMGIQTPNSIPPLVTKGTRTTMQSLQLAMEEASNLYRENPDVVFVLLNRKGVASTELGVYDCIRRD